MTAELKSLPSGADDIEAQAADWLQRRHFWNWGAQYQETLDAWLNESPAHLIAYLRLEAAFIRTDRLTALRLPLSTRLVGLARRGWWPVFRRVAAALLIAAGVGVAIRYSEQPKAKTYSASVGDRKILTLADGSRIELNTDTVLRLSADARQRTVWLDRGEAYFQIRHDAIHPFTVITSDHRITDLGTKFLVRKERNHIEVSLVEGRARVDSSSTWRPSQSALLTPGDVVVATADSMSLMKKSATALGDELGWRRGLLVFRDSSLLDAAAEFNRYNTHKIVITDQAAAHLVVGGTFPANDTSLFVRAAQRLFGLRADIRGNETVISR